ncbi:AAA+-like ATPase [Thermacetogenium phaeum DSM 12270]|uniref:AAA+-like ATPase n=2 Tax=Thermacetogenium phaeum TaxID=85874 RepID=K4LKZ0_THEPS|nr:AAA+-like ATPase [Thermacetogenium phaeum DSM 12270]
MDFNNTGDIFYRMRLALSSLSIYRNLLDDNAIKTFTALAESLCSRPDPITFLNLYNELFFSLASSNTTLAGRVIDLIIYDDNPFSRRCATGQDWKALEGAVRNDLRALQLVAQVPSSAIKERAAALCKLDKALLDELPELTYSNNNLPEGTTSGPQEKLKQALLSGSSWEECLDELARFYREVGAGIFAHYRAFIWERRGESGRLKGIAFPDPVRLSDLYGYEEERAQVLENTLQFLKGYPANNVLLYGDRGTGKSSTVKALVNEYHSQGLRIIEVPKEYLGDFPEIIRILRGRRQKFIIFVDDLTFADSTENYTALKAVLEGGLESRPDNALIYATSNRRHLVKEEFSDRPDLEGEEIRKNDTVQEKLSLADRFGITVIFTAPDQEKYLKIISALAQQRGILVPQDLLHREALRWAERHNGRSPRTAHQFIDWFEGHLALQKQASS